MCYVSTMMNTMKRGHVCITTVTGIRILILTITLNIVTIVTIVTKLAMGALAVVRVAKTFCYLPMLMY